MIEPARVSASAMARMLQASPLFRLPERPRLLAGLVMVPIQEGLVVEGTERRQVLRGRGVASLLPRLLPLLDGARTPAEVAAALSGVPAEAVENALALLYARGLLEDAAVQPAAAAAGVPPALAGFVTRHVDVTRVNRSAGEALHRLRSAAVAAEGDPEAATLLGEELAACGVALAGHEQASLVVCLLTGTEDEAALAEMDDRLAARRMPWLRASLVGSRAELGPYFSWPRGRCYRCFAATRDRHGAAGPAAPARLRTWVALVAAEIVFLASRVCPPTTGQAVVAIDMADWSRRRLSPPRLPGCPVCCPLPGPPACEVETAVAYEQAVASPPPDLLDPKRHQAHFLAANHELQAQRRRYPSHRLEPLGPDALPAAALLRRTAGLRAAEPRVKRWAPTAGNLGSVQVYLVARQLAGVAPGVYAHAAWDDALAPLDYEGPPADLDGLFERAGAAGSLALLVMTADLGLAAAKYGPSAYHLVHLDAGAALAQCSAVAADLGLTARPLPGWDDALLGELLLLDPEREPVTAVVALHGAAP